MDTAETPYTLLTAVSMKTNYQQYNLYMDDDGGGMDTAITRIVMRVIAVSMSP
jgi:hypothetical protein